MVAGLIPSREGSRYTLLMRPNKIKTAVRWICILHAVLAEFSNHGNSIYKYIYQTWIGFRLGSEFRSMVKVPG